MVTTRPPGQLCQYECITYKHLTCTPENIHSFGRKHCNGYFALFTVLFSPLEAFEQLFFAVFGMSTITALQKGKGDYRPAWTEYLFKIVFMIYMLVSVVVLINLLIAMMSDTYQRIQAQSDIEWKYGLAKLIRNMHRTTTTPSPLNLITSWLMYLLHLCRQKGEFLNTHLFLI